MKALDAQITTQLRKAFDPGAMRTLLSAAAEAATVGYLNKPIPPNMGNMLNAAAKCGDTAPPKCGSFVRSSP